MSRSEFWDRKADGSRSRSLDRDDSIKAWKMRQRGMGFAGIASRMDCSPGAVRSAIARVDGGRYGEVQA